MKKNGKIYLVVLFHTTLLSFIELHPLPFKGVKKNLPFYFMD